MRTGHLCEFLDAAHLTTMVESPYDQRGGIMLVGPPGTLKSSIMKSSLGYYPQALIISDLNVNTLTRMQDELITGRYTTICFEEMEKLYQRKADTASNIEGVLKALVDQGFMHASFQDQRMAGIAARTLIVGAMTYGFYARKFPLWRETGFARRFLWLTFRTRDYAIIGDAIEKRIVIALDGILRVWPKNRKIPFSITDEEARKIRRMLRDQADENTPQILLQKILAVLKWKYEKNTSKALEVITEIAPLMLNKGGEMEIVLQ